MKQNEPEPSLGRRIGSSIGATVGSWAQGALRSLIGRGDYAEAHEEMGGGFDVKENSLLEAPETSIPTPLTSAAPVPHMNEIGEGALRIRHREFIRDVTTAGSPFNTSFLRLQPTDATTFPWLSQIASRFEQWIPMGIVFEFVSTYGNAISSTNAALGSIVLATQYNSYAPVFTSKTEMLNHYFSVSTKPSCNLMHAVECNPSELPTNVLFTAGSPGGLAPNDEQFYNLGYTYYATEGQQSALGTLGELHVTYDIVLLKPKIYGIVPAPLRVSFHDMEEYCRENKLSIDDFLPSRIAELRDLVIASRGDELSEEEEKQVVESHDSFVKGLSRSLSSLPPSQHIARSAPWAIIPPVRGRETPRQRLDINH